MIRKHRRKINIYNINNIKEINDCDKMAIRRKQQERDISGKRKCDMAETRKKISNKVVND